MDSPTQHFRRQKSLYWWRVMMVLVIMGNLSSVRYLFISSFTQLNLYLEQSQTQLLTFVCGLSGMLEGLGCVDLLLYSSNTILCFLLC